MLPLIVFIKLSITTITAGESVIFFPANGINGNILVYCWSFIYAIFILKVLNMENILY